MNVKMRLPDVRDREIGVISKCECKRLSIRVGVPDTGCQCQFSFRPQGYSHPELKTEIEYIPR